jgi:hypothetical protein
MRLAPASGQVGSSGQCQILNIVPDCAGCCKSSGFARRRRDVSQWAGPEPLVRRRHTVPQPHNYSAASNPRCLSLEAPTPLQLASFRARASPAVPLAQSQQNSPASLCQDVVAISVICGTTVSVAASNPEFITAALPSSASASGGTRIRCQTPTGSSTFSCSAQCSHAPEPRRARLTVHHGCRETAVACAPAAMLDTRLGGRTASCRWRGMLSVA